MYSAVNISLGIVSVVIILILILCQVTSPDKSETVNRLFVAVMALVAVMQVADILAWAFDDWPGAFFLVLTRVANFMVYTVGISANIIYIGYISESIPLRGRVKKITFGAIGVISAILEVLIITTQFNGGIYSVDSGNHFHWGPYYWMAHLLLSLTYIVILIAVLQSRRKLELRDMLTYMGYALIPLAAVLTNLVFYRLMVTYVAITIALLVIYVNIQQQRERKMKQQEIALQNQKIAIMLSQIQPHFLYNTLASINDLCRDNPKAQKAILAFSKYLRTNMDSLSRKGLVPFSTELEHVRQYLWLEQLRFEERLAVVYDIGPDGFSLPVLTLQPIAENAVQHGISQKAGGGTVTLRTEETENSFRITVADDGAGFDPAEILPGSLEHTGIHNVRTRLEALCGGTLTVDSAPGRGTTVVLEIPKEREVRV